MVSYRSWYSFFFYFSLSLIVTNLNCSRGQARTIFLNIYDNTSPFMVGSPKGEEPANPDGRVEFVPIFQGVSLTFQDRQGQTQERIITIVYNIPNFDFIPIELHKDFADTYSEAMSRGNEILIRMLELEFSSPKGAALYLEPSPLGLNQVGLFSIENAILFRSPRVEDMIDLADYLYLEIHQTMTRQKIQQVYDGAIKSYWRRVSKKSWLSKRGTHYWPSRCQLYLRKKSPSEDSGV